MTFCSRIWYFSSPCNHHWIAPPSRTVAHEPPSGTSVFSTYQNEPRKHTIVSQYPTFSSRPLLFDLACCCSCGSDVERKIYDCQVSHWSSLSIQGVTNTNGSYTRWHGAGEKWVEECHRLAHCEGNLQSDEKLHSHQVRVLLTVRVVFFRLSPAFPSSSRKHLS